MSLVVDPEARPDAPPPTAVEVLSVHTEDLRLSHRQLMEDFVPWFKRKKKKKNKAYWRRKVCVCVYVWIMSFGSDVDNVWARYK